MKRRAKPIWTPDHEEYLRTLEKHLEHCATSVHQLMTLLSPGLETSAFSARDKDLIRKWARARLHGNLRALLDTLT